MKGPIAPALLAPQGRALVIPDGPRRLVPGVLLCGVVALAALGLQGLEVQVFGRTWIEALVLAIVLGAAARAAVGLPKETAPGLEFCGKTLLETAVALLGAGLSAGALASAGPALLLGVALIVALVIPAGVIVGRALGLPTRMSLLIACGNAICGNSAIAAIAPVIGAESEEVIPAIGFTAVLGVVVVLTLPLLAVLLGLTPRAYGALAGLTVYAVPQVIAAAAPGGALAVQVGALLKLVRVLMLGPVVVILSLLYGRRTGAARPSLARLAPWFILAFLALAGLRSAGLLPAEVIAPAAGLASAFTVLAMAALGLSVDFAAVRRAGPRASAAVVISLLVLAGLALGLIRLVGLR